MQEALGLGRREYISTHDFEENMTGLISARALNATRLVNKAGTKESRQTEDQKSDLSKWNSMLFLPCFLTVFQKCFLIDVSFPSLCQS